MLDKQRVVDAILERLQQELAVLVASAQSAREAATHEESKPEDSHDTRGLEASYLAGAQAERAASVQRMIALIKFLPVRPVPAGDGAAAGSLLEIESGGKRSWYFLVSQGGGITVTVDGQSIQVITPASPLGEELMGRPEGDEFEIENQGKVREYRIRSLR